MTKYTRETLELYREAIDRIQDARGALNNAPYSDEEAQSTEDALAKTENDFEVYTTEYHFILCLQEQAEKDGYSLVDDGTMDTVLQCPTCNGWLRFDGREGAIMHMEDDDCWLCGTDEDDKGA